MEKENQKPKAKQPKKEHVVYLRVSAQMKIAVQRAAADAKMGESAFVNKILERQLSDYYNAPTPDDDSGTGN